MKRFISLSIILSFFVLMLCFPQETFIGAGNGLLLWFQIILPTLLPFIILSNLLIHTNSVHYIARILKPLLQRLFGVSESACYAILVGFLCGYPMGAKVIADLIHTGHLTTEEGQYLLSFCNNTSPMFILSFIVLQNFKNESLAFGTLFILFLSPILCSFLFRKFYRISPDSHIQTLTIGKPFHFNFRIFDDSIMNGFETITRVGGYIILFSILFVLGDKLPLNWYLPALEISNGIPWLLNLGLSFHATYPLVLALTSFGGFCAIAQTYAMIQDSKLSIVPYIIQKLITAMVTSLLALIYLFFILQ